MPVLVLVFIEVTCGGFDAAGLFDSSLEPVSLLVKNFDTVPVSVVVYFLMFPEW